MKIRWYLLLLLFPFFSCSLSFNDNDKDDEFNVRLIMNYSGGFVLSDASYTFINLESGDEETGSLDFNNDTASVFGDVDLEEGYWKGYITLEKEYDATTGIAFNHSTETITRFISKNTDEIWFEDPFSGNTNTFYADVYTYELSQYYTVDKAGVWLIGKDGKSNYFFELRNNYSTDFFDGQLDFVRNGDYTVFLAARNATYPGWTDWDLSRTVLSPYLDINIPNTTNLPNISLSGRTYLYYDNYCINTNYPDSDVTNLYSYDLFFPHNQNGSTTYLSDPIVYLDALDSNTPASLSLERYPMGQNRMVDFYLNFDYANRDLSVPLLSLYFKESAEKPETRVEVHLWADHVEIASYINGVNTTYVSDPALLLTVGDQISILIRDDKLGIYQNSSNIPDVSVALDPAIPDDLHLHFESRQTNTAGAVNLSNLQIMNNFYFAQYTSFSAIVYP